MPDPIQNPLDVYNARIKDGTLKSDPAQAKAAQALQKLYNDLTRKQSSRLKFWKKRDATPKGIYMYGGVGRGKSMLMDLFYECLPDDIGKRRVHFHAFMIEVHDYIHTRRQEDDFEDGIDGVLPMLAARIAEKSKVLCFDEFHVTDVADAMILGRLFTALFEWDVIVIATSNWPPDDLYKGGLQRDRFVPFIELMKRKLEIVHLDSPTDYRTQFLQSEGTYFWPLGEATMQKADEVFARLTDGIPPVEEQLAVKRRIIPVRTSAKGIARFTFAQLCESPHGAEDYLAIAKTYNTVFLENIPKIGYDRRNEAKRLMTLIDALYDTGTKLIATADAPPDKLYRGQDHEFEFQRTVSRLLEMQSEAYLSGNE